MISVNRSEVEGALGALSAFFDVAPCNAHYALRRLTPEKLRAAFKRVALSTHPDRASALGRDAKQLASEFREARRSYDVLEDLLRNREHRAAVCAALASSARPTGHHEGMVPRRRLRFAEFLYYSRVIHRREIIRAIRWQSTCRPRIGELATAWGKLNAEEAQAVERARRPSERFGECAQRKGVLTDFWVRVLLRRQQALDRPIGTYFVERGILNEEDLGHALDFHRRHNAAHEAS